jgi:hypothetical protein
VKRAVLRCSFGRRLLQHGGLPVEPSRPYGEAPTPISDGTDATFVTWRRSHPDRAIEVSAGHPRQEQQRRPVRTLTSGTLLDLGPADWVDSYSQPLRLVVERVDPDGGFYDHGVWRSVEGHELEWPADRRRVFYVRGLEVVDAAAGRYRGVPR